MAVFLRIVEKLTKTKTIAMLLLIGIATIGAVGTAIGTGMAYACPNPPCHRFDTDDVGHGQSFHDSNGDLHSNGQA